MLVIDFDEKRCYYYRKDLVFIEDFVIEFCKEHLKNDYQEDIINRFVSILKWYLKDSFRSKSFFLMKEKTLYYWSSLPNIFCEVVHPIFKISDAGKTDEKFWAKN